MVALFYDSSLLWWISYIVALFYGSSLLWWISFLMTLFSDDSLLWGSLNDGSLSWRAYLLKKNC